MTWAVTSGFDMEWVINLDMQSFDSLINSLHRQQNSDMLRSIFAARIAQAEEKEYKKAVKSLQKEISATDSNDAQAFNRSFGRGI